MFRAIIQNSFLAFTEVEDITCKKRSRSVDSVMGKQLAEVETQASVLCQLGRFDQMLNAGLSTMPEQEQPVKVMDGKMNVKLGLGLKKGFASNSSVSTMAPDDASDCDDEFDSAPLGHFSGLKAVASSGSVFSMISEDQESSFEDFDSGSNGFTATPDGSPGGSLARAAPTPPQPLVKSQPAAFPVRSPIDDFSHCHVPRHINLAQEFAINKPAQAAPTTIMIRNIPNRHTQAQIMRELENLGFGGTFDFFYAPMDKCTRCTVGYAFVNFLDPYVAARCMKVMENHWFTTHGRQRAKQARVSVAHLQGLEANIKHYKDAAVNNGPQEGQRGPVIMPNLARSLGAW